MPRFTTQKSLPYTPEQMTALVADVRSYPEFLPWCKGARVFNRKTGVFDADLVIGFNMFRETFTSRVTVEPGRKVYVDYLKGPLKRLYNHWLFHEADGGGCLIDFDVDFEFANSILENLIGEVFQRATNKMIGAFEERAHVLYGPNAAEPA